MTLSQQIGKIIDEKLRAMKLDASKTTAVSGDNWSDGTQKVKTLNGLSGAVTLLEGDSITITVDGQSITIAGEPAENGIPPGGTTNQLLAKNSDDDFDGKWVDAPEAANGIPSGGDAGQILAKIDDTDFNAAWINAPVGSEPILTAVKCTDTPSGTTLTESIDVSEGDIVIAAFVTRSESSVPTGWNLIKAEQVPYPQYIYTAYKIVESGETTVSITVTQPNEGRIYITLMAVSGAGIPVYTATATAASDSVFVQIEKPVKATSILFAHIPLWGTSSPFNSAKVDDGVIPVYSVSPMAQGRLAAVFESGPARTLTVTFDVYESIGQAILIEIPAA